MEENIIAGPRNYKKLGIDGVVLIKSKVYTGDDGWMSEPIDFSELAYFLGYRFEPSSIHMYAAPVGVVRGGHLEGRSKSLTVPSGSAFVILVNMRVGEEQGKVVCVYVGEGENAWGNTLLIPEGVVAFAMPLTKDCIFYSVADRPFNRFDSEIALDVFDPKLKISWPKDVKPKVLDKKSKILKLDEFIQTL